MQITQFTCIYTQWPLVSSQISLHEIDKKYDLKQWSFLAN